MQIKIEIPIREFVKSKMISMGYKQQDLSRQSGVCPAIISHYFNNKRDIQVGTLEKILRVLK